MTTPLQVAPYDPRRRAIVTTSLEDFHRILTGTAILDLDGARILDLRHDHERDTVDLLVTSPTLDEVPPGVEPRRIPATIRPRP